MVLSLPIKVGGPNPMTNNTSCPEKNEVNIHAILVDRKEDFHINASD